MALGLGAVIAAGQMQLAQTSMLQLSNIYTNMASAQLTNAASQQSTLMNAASGIGKAYSDGSANLYNSIFSANHEMANAFRKAA